ncbi:hypothetical protein KR032_001713 [Drosophila birchii]|nr:hypothetical protein KR032_001713 [Drosophila birchii]
MSPKNNHDPTSSGESGSANVQEADLQGEFSSLLGRATTAPPRDCLTYIMVLPPAEMEDVNQSLDELSCALDAVEQRTDDIMSQLRELLNSNREIRRLLAEEKDNAAQPEDDSMEGQSSNENDAK